MDHETPASPDHAALALLRSVSEPVPYEAVDFDALRRRVARDVFPPVAEQGGATTTPRVSPRTWLECTARWATAVVPLSLAASIALVAVGALGTRGTSSDPRSASAPRSRSSSYALRAADITDTLLAPVDATHVLYAVLNR
jgi:hypothetical protein